LTLLRVKTIGKHLTEILNHECSPLSVPIKKNNKIMVNRGNEEQRETSTNSHGGNEEGYILIFHVKKEETLNRVNCNIHGSYPKKLGE